MTPELFFRDAALVIVGGGSGRRFGGNKLLEEWREMPVFLHSMKQLGSCFPDGNRIFVAPESELSLFQELAQRYLPELPFCFVSGGATRSASVQAGLAAVPGSAAYVAIHDAARPLATADLLARVLAGARRVGGAIPGRRVVDTLKRCNEQGLIAQTVARDDLWAVETPQCFSVKTLLEAYRRCPEAQTDDAGVMECAGFPVTVVEDPGENFKITYPEDLRKLRLLT